MEMPFQHYVLGLFAVANNIPAIPVYLDLCKDLDPAGQRKICSVATISSLITMIVSMLCGAVLLGFFGIGIPAFRIAGGLLLLQTGMNMMSSRPKEAALAEKKHLSEIISVAVIPIAIPLTTGAGTMSTVILFAQGMNEAVATKLLGAIMIVTVVNYVLFRWSSSVVRILGHTGMDVVTKVFGLITLALGIQFMLTGWSESFPALGGSAK